MGGIAALFICARKRRQSLMTWRCLEKIDFVRALIVIGTSHRAPTPNWWPAICIQFEYI
jgi:hypothetical protein